METGIEHDQEASIALSPEASIECNLEVDTEFEPEVHTGNTLRVCLRTGQEPKLKIIVKLIPKMNRPIPKTISRNPQIRESASGCLKTGIRQQKAGNLLPNCLSRTWSHV